MNTPDTGWSQIPEDLSLVPGEIHLWRAELDLSPARLALLSKALSSEERDRAARFHFDRDRDRFSAGRGLLRALLGRYLKKESHQVAFTYSQYGKPLLAAESGAVDIHFNISHSGGIAVFAFLRGHSVGVDIERICQDVKIDSLAGSAFSAPEVAELVALPRHQQRDAFYAIWTRKESYVKALGTGLHCPLQEFAVSLGDTRITLLTPTGGSLGNAPERVIPLCCGSEYAGALAVAGSGWRLKQFAV